MINKIVVTWPEAMVEFSPENQSLRSSKILLTCVNYIRLNIGQGIFSLEVNKPLGLQITLGSEGHVSRNEIRSLCNSR